MTQQCVFIHPSKWARITLLYIAASFIALVYTDTDPSNNTILSGSVDNFGNNPSTGRERFPVRGLEQILSSQTVPLESLWLLYETIPRNLPLSLREISYVKSPRRSGPYSDVTLVTQMSMIKTDRLVNLLERWDGPVSCAVYLPSIESILDFFSFVKNQKHESFHDMVSLHVILERPGAAYPINRLRNLALENIETEYFFYVDVDFIPSQGIYHRLRDFVTLNTNPKRYSTLYVVPAFEVRGSPSVLPRTSDDLSGMILSGKAQGFHMEYFSKGHNSTNFTKWLGCHGKSYPIEYTYMFEPYVVGSIHSIHHFDARMRGYGLNKWSWFVEANLRGYYFEVLCGIFLVHMDHEHYQRRIGRDVIALQQWYEKTYWRTRYDVAYS